ncbi:MAG: aldehyde dehydrogenase family protein [Sandaracinaceae bacterium]
MGWITQARGEGTQVDAPQGTIRSYAPATGELLGEVPVMDAERVRDAVARARRAQEAWALLPIEERCERIRRFRDEIVRRADEVVELIARECGKPKAEALTHEVFITADLATWYAREAPRILAPRELDLHLLKHRRAEVLYAPRGVVGIISPWNFPFVIPMGDVLAALVAGNGVVLKPSEVTPLIALKAKELYDAAGLPDDLFSVVTGDGKTGAALIDAGVDKVVFTGGVETGRKVAAACGERLIEATMELGGKAPVIVCDDADLERAARAVVFGGFANSGQVCIGVERVYAQGGIYDRLVERVVALTRELRQGDPLGDVDLGAIIFPPQIDNATRLIEDAVSRGAQLRCGGGRPDREGQFFEPTVLTGCGHDMAVMREEIFRPIVPIMRVTDDEEAIALANDSHLGLAAYVFSADRERARAIAERVRAGMVLVNDVVIGYAVSEAPFGGVKASGYGKIHGAESLRGMCEAKHLGTERIPMPARDPFWFPYQPAMVSGMRRALRAVYARGTLGERLGRLFG